MKRNIVENLDFILHLHSTSQLKGTCWNFAIMFRAEKKTTIMELQEGEKNLSTCLAVSIQHTNVTDGHRAIPYATL